MRIVRLTASNLKRLVAVEISPDGKPLIRITGKNGAGKSSVLDAILMALGGERAIPSHPIRNGASKAEVVIDLGELVVRRRFTAKGTTLEVTAADGSNLRSPQAVLDKLVGDLAFDPLDFARLKPREQLERLAALTDLGLDVEGLVGAAAEAGLTLPTKGTENGIELQLLDAFERGLEEKRKAAGAAAKALAAWAKPESAGPFVEPVDMAALAAKRKVIEAARDAHMDFVHRADLAAQELRREEENLNRQDLEVAELRKRLGNAEANLAAVKVRRDAAWETATAQREAMEARGLPPSFTEHDREAAAAEETNRLAAQGALVREKITEANAAAAAHARAEAALAAFRDFKRQTMEAADFPVPGLSFGDNEVLFNGLPLEQASDAERLRVAVAIAMAANPKLRVIRIRDGSLLDSAGMAALEELARGKDYQVWIESVGEDRAVGVHIEDGEIVAVDGEEARS